MKEPPHIRPAQSDEGETLTAIRRMAILTLAAEKIGSDQAHIWANAAAPNRVQYAIEEHQVWVAAVAGQVVGWVEVNGNRIEGLYVQPQWAQQGIGSTLLTYAEEEIRSAGCSSVRLEASENAEAFYIRRGYRPLAERSPETGRPMVKPLIHSLGD